MLDRVLQLLQASHEAYVEQLRETGNMNLFLEDLGRSNMSRYPSEDVARFDRQFREWPSERQKRLRDGRKSGVDQTTQNQLKPVLEPTTAFSEESKATPKSDSLSRAYQEGQEAYLGRVSPTNPYRVAMRSLTDPESLESLNKLAIQWEDGYVSVNR